MADGLGGGGISGVKSVTIVIIDKVVGGEVNLMMKWGEAMRSHQ